MSSRARFLIRNSTWIVAIIIGISVCLRCVLIVHNWPTTNSDEGTMGMMAFHIAYRGEYPLIFYGQNYMGTIEAYIAAPFFHAAGASLFTLRLGLVVLFLLFMIVMYLLTTLLYSRKLAFVTLVILGLAPKDVLALQLTAIGGYPELPLFGALILLLASFLALTMPDIATPVCTSKRRLGLYLLWAIVAGMGFWDDFLTLPFLLAGGLLLLLACWREIRQPVVLCCIVGGFLLGASPMIAQMFRVPLSENPLLIFRTQGNWARLPHSSIWDSIIGTMDVSLPLMTGANTLCTVITHDAPPLRTLADPMVHGCTAVHLAWSGGFILLIGLAIIGAFRVYWRFMSRGAIPVHTEERALATLHLARLLLLSTAVLNLLIYITTPQPASVPWTASRYLIGLLVAFPGILWPLWSRIETSMSLWDAVKRKKTLVIGCMLLSLVLVTTFLGSVAAPGAIAEAQTDYNQEQKLIHDLERLGITHFYTEYWTCDRITFESQEKLTCAVVGTNLGHGMNRYLPYSLQVWKDPASPYVVPVGTPYEKWVRERAAKKTGRLLIVDRYVVYFPSP